MSDPVDTYTEVTTRSWGNKIAGALIGLVLGPLMVLGACIALFWNEGRAVQTARSLTEGASIVVEVPPSPVSLANQGLLVHVTGDMKAGTKLSDPDFAVTADAVRPLLVDLTALAAHVCALAERAGDADLVSQWYLLTPAALCNPTGCNLYDMPAVSLGVAREDSAIASIREAAIRTGAYRIDPDYGMTRLPKRDDPNSLLAFDFMGRDGSLDFLRWWFAPVLEG